MRVAVLTFPGSNCDYDLYQAVKQVGGEPVWRWHRDRGLEGMDAVLLPGGFSYGDYLRAGAIARFSPIMEDVRAEERVTLSSLQSEAFHDVVAKPGVFEQRRHFVNAAHRGHRHHGAAFHVVDATKCSPSTCFRDRYMFCGRSGHVPSTAQSIDF